MKRLILLCFILLLPLPFSPVFGQDTAPQNEEAAAEEIPYPYQEDLERAEAEGDSRFYREFINMLVMLGILIALLYGGTWLIKRMTYAKVTQQGTGGGAVQILTKQPISQRTTIYVLEVAGKEIVIAESMNSTTFLGYSGGSQGVPTSFEHLVKEGGEEAKS